jgi:hypothetical protein
MSFALVPIRTVIDHEPVSKMLYDVVVIGCGERPCPRPASVVTSGNAIYRNVAHRPGGNGTVNEASGATQTWGH